LQTQNKFILCYVTDSASLSAHKDMGLCEVMHAVAGARVDWIQIREKTMATRNLLGLVRDAVSATNRGRIFVNDRLDVAAAAGADGVHLGGESLRAGDVAGWRRAGRNPASFQIGVSCHGLEDIRQAECDGAGYVFFGPVFLTPSKARFGPPQGLVKLTDACRSTHLPVLAIGGVNEMNVHDCAHAGAAGIAATRLFQQAHNLPELIRRLRQTN
jgi:thiamine-phosphate pyrophosphorylase